MHFIQRFNIIQFVLNPTQDRKLEEADCLSDAHAICVTAAIRALLFVRSRRRRLGKTKIYPKLVGTLLHQFVDFSLQCVQIRQDLVTMFSTFHHRRSSRAIPSRYRADTSLPHPLPTKGRRARSRMATTPSSRWRRGRGRRAAILFSAHSSK